MVQLVGELQAVGSLRKLRVVVHVATWVSWNVREGFYVLVHFLLAKSEVKEIKRDLTVSKLCSCIFEEGVCRLPKIYSLSACFWRICCVGWKQLWVSQNHLRGLEEHHLTSNMLNDIVSALKCSNEAWLCSFLSLEIHWQVIQKIDYQIIAVLKIHEKIIRLGHKHVIWISDHHHLRLL